MTTQMQVQVRSADGASIRDVTAQVSGGSFSTGMPGGFRDAQIDLAQPLTLAGGAFEAGAELIVTDGQDASRVWEGLLQDPGRSGGSGGPVWKLNALGLASTTLDVERPYAGIVAGVGSWQDDRSGFLPTWANRETKNDTDVAEAIRLGAPDGIVVNNTASARTIATRLFRGLFLSGQSLATLRFDVVAGLTSASFTWDFDVALSGLVDFGTLSGVPAAKTYDSVSDAFSGSIPQLSLAHVGGAGATAPAECWVSFGGVVLRPEIVEADGTAIASNTLNPTSITAAEIIGDWLGSDRVPMISGTTATITPPGSPHTYGHLYWPTPVTFSKVLEDLMVFESGQTWAVWDDGRFYWQQWPTSVRYDLDANLDQFEGSGSTVGMYNAVSVTYTDQFGDISTVRRTATVPELGDRLVERELDLGQNLSVTSTEAETAGDNFLADHSFQQRGGTCTVNRPVYDRLHARWIPAHQMRAGYLARVANLDPSLAAITDRLPNGNTVYRVVSTSTDILTGATACELGAFAPSVERQLAQGRRDFATRRR